MQKYIKLKFFIIILFVVFSIISCERKLNNLTSIFKDIGISINGFENFILDENKNNRIVAHENKTILTISLIKNIQKELAYKFISDKIAVLEAQYEIRDATYPGEVTKEIVCPEQFKPIKNIIQNSYNIANYKLFSTKSFTYGVCAEDLIFYKTFLGFFYCDKKGLFQIELFVPINNEKKFNEALKKISSFEC